MRTGMLPSRFFRPLDTMDDSPKRNQLEPDDYYYSPEGYIVFTAKYLLRRGYCCQNGCKHCPYGFNKKTGRFDKDKKT